MPSSSAAVVIAISAMLSCCSDQALTAKVQLYTGFGHFQLDRACVRNVQHCVLQIGMVEAIAQLVHKDYSAIVDTFVTLEFIPPGTDLKPILPVLAKVRLRGN